MFSIREWLSRPANLDRLAGLVDQALYSLATLAQTYVYARVLTPDNFGVFGLLQGTCLLAQGMQRSFTVLPMIMTAHPHGDSSWLRLDMVMRIIVSAALALLAVGGGWIGIGPQFRLAMGLAALCTTATLAYEMQRRSLFLLRKSGGVIASAATYFVVTAITVASVALFVPRVEAAAAGLFVSAAMAAILAWNLRGPLPPPALRLRDFTSTIGWNLLSFFPYAVYNNGMILIVGALADLRAVALFTASRLFTAPIQVLVQAIDSVDKPRARRMFADGGEAGLSRSLAGTQRTLIVLGLPYLIAIVFAAGPLSHALFGHRFPGMPDAVRAWSVVGLLMLISQPQETGLIISGLVDRMFLNRCVSAAAVILFLYLGKSLTLTIGPIIALAIGWSIGGILAWQALHRRLRTSA